MGQMSWTYDATTGVYKNRALSSDIRMAAIAETKFMEFVKVEPGAPGKGKGESVTIARIANLTVPTSDALTELERIPEDEFSMSTQAITVIERGRAVPYTSLSNDLGALDMENTVQKVLRNQLALRLDNVACDAFQEGQYKVIPDGVASLTADTDGTASTTAAANLNTYHVSQIRDILFTTLNVAPAAGGNYVGLVSTKAKRGLMSDPNWEKWKTPNNPGAKSAGDLGIWEGIRFVEINNTGALSGSLGASSVLGEALFFGDDPVVMATVIDPELRTKSPEDYGRSLGVAWYGIYGFGQVWKDSASAGQCRVVHVTSA